MKQTHLIGLAAFGMLALAGCTTTSPNYGSSGYGSSAPYPSQARCADCGLVTRIDLLTDAVVRTEGAEVTHSAGQRLYGKVEGDLMYALDRATTEHELRPHMWARLKRV